jgi:hypothetical protein
MRIMFSLAGLLVVLAIIGFTVKKQLNSLAPPAQEATPTGTNLPDTSPIPTPAGTPQQQVQQVQSNVQRALEQAAARASDADH